MVRFRLDRIVRTYRSRAGGRPGRFERRSLWQSPPPSPPPVWSRCSSSEASGTLYPETETQRVTAGLTAVINTETRTVRGANIPTRPAVSVDSQQVASENCSKEGMHQNQQDTSLGNKLTIFNEEYYGVSAWLGLGRGYNLNKDKPGGKTELQLEEKLSKCWHRNCWHSCIRFSSFFFFFIKSVHQR